MAPLFATADALYGRPLHPLSQHRVLRRRVAPQVLAAAYALDPSNRYTTGRKQMLYHLPRTSYTVDVSCTYFLFSESTMYGCF